MDQSIFRTHKKPPILTKCCLHAATKVELSIGPLPLYVGLPDGSEGKESIYFARDLGLIPGLGRSPGGGPWQPTPVVELLVGYSPWGCKESGPTEATKHSTAVLALGQLGSL